MQITMIHVGKSERIIKNGALIPKLPRHPWISWVKRLSSWWGNWEFGNCLGLREDELWDVNVHVYFTHSVCNGRFAWCTGLCCPVKAVSSCSSLCKTAV